DRDAFGRRGPDVPGRGGGGEQGRGRARGPGREDPDPRPPPGRVRERPPPTRGDGRAGKLAGSDIAEIASRLDPSIKVIVSAHTHAEYRCTITAGGVTRLITSASSFGRILTDITLTVDDKSGELVQAEATNTVVANALNAPGPGVVRIPDPSREDPHGA